MLNAQRLIKKHIKFKGYCLLSFLFRLNPPFLFISTRSLSLQPLIAMTSLKECLEPRQILCFVCYKAPGPQINTQFGRIQIISLHIWRVSGAPVRQNAAYHAAMMFTVKYLYKANFIIPQKWFPGLPRKMIQGRIPAQRLAMQKVGPKKKMR